LWATGECRNCPPEIGSKIIFAHLVLFSFRPKIALEMEYRSGKQCRERYINQLDPLIKKSMWTVEEDSTIKRIHFEIGKKWCRYMDQLPGRSDNAIKNRYHVISRDNYAEHNLHHAASLAIVVTQPEGVFVPETAAVRLDRFRSARDLLDAKIEALDGVRDLRAEEAVEDEEEMQMHASADIFETLQEGFSPCGSGGTPPSGATTAEVAVDDHPAPKSSESSVSTVPSTLSAASLFGNTAAPQSQGEFASLDFGSQDFSTVMDEFHFDFEDMCYEYSHGTNGEVLGVHA